MKGLALAACLALFVACTSGTEPGPTPTASEHPSPAPSGPGSAQQAMAELCQRPPLKEHHAEPVKNVPEFVSQTEEQVEAVRGLQYEHPVAVAAVTQKELVQGINRGFDHSFPVDQTARRTEAWQTIGVIPRSSDLQEAFQQFYSTQVIGFYDPASKELEFIGSENPSPSQRFVLAHELTHALDDQHFDLELLNGIENRCQDERLMAAVGLVEGSAVYYSVAVLRRFFTPGEQTDAVSQPVAPPEGIPQFLLNLQTWPYIAGPLFIGSLDLRGGTDAVNDAFEHPPVSTEQVMHPEKYPNDVPTPLDIPDLGPKLGKRWRDLDVETVGEEWLKVMLGLRLDPTEGDPAAEGWDGGLYRAWTDGKHVAVVLRTAWDSEQDRNEFEAGLVNWIDSSKTAEVGPSTGTQLDALFASDAATLSDLRRATS